MAAGQRRLIWCATCMPVRHGTPPACRLPESPSVCQHPKPASTSSPLPRTVGIGAAAGSSGSLPACRAPRSSPTWRRKRSAASLASLATVAAASSTRRMRPSASSIILVCCTTRGRGRPAAQVAPSSAVGRGRADEREQGSGAHTVHRSMEAEAGRPLAQAGVWVGRLARRQQMAAPADGWRYTRFPPFVAPRPSPSPPAPPNTRPPGASPPCCAAARIWAAGGRQPPGLDCLRAPAAGRGPVRKTWWRPGVGQRVAPDKARIPGQGFARRAEARRLANFMHQPSLRAQATANPS